jgi:hypothetical protein
VIRHEIALEKILDWVEIPDEDIYEIFFINFDQATSHKSWDYFYSWIFDNFNFPIHNEMIEIAIKE